MLVNFGGEFTSHEVNNLGMLVSFKERADGHDWQCTGVRQTRQQYDCGDLYKVLASMSVILTSCFFLYWNAVCCKLGHCLEEECTEKLLQELQTQKT